MPFLETRLARDDGSEAGVGEAGELLLRGPQMFAGYLDDAARTAEAIDADGWLRTGDLARRDADGAFTICGRRKEMFISGAENVYPGEVEAVLMQHPAVAEVAVVGVADAKWGEVGRAFVSVRAGRVAAGSRASAKRWRKPQRGGGRRRRGLYRADRASVPISSGLKSPIS